MMMGRGKRANSAGYWGDGFDDLFSGFKIHITSDSAFFFGI